MPVVQFARFGDPAEVLEVVDAPELTPPGPDEVAVDFVASPINPSDLLTVRGEYGVRPELPATPGYEGVGRVTATGEGVAHLKTGDLVLLAGARGTWRSRLTLKAARLFALPQADPLQLSMLIANPPTALLMLEQFVPLEHGQWVIQNAANSGVGIALVAIARVRGLHTVNVVRRESAAEALTAAGGDVVLVDGPDLAKRVRAALAAADAQPDALRLAIDAVGGHATGRLARCVAEGGTVVSYGGLSGEPCVIEARDTIFRDITLKGFWLSRWFTSATPAELSRVFGTVAGLVAGGTIRVPIEATYPLAHVRDAAAHAAREGRDGKVLLVAR
ncbi:MAG TPA: zinc-dependent alcohol dehydrogenase family protein [Gemmatirosa sp.]